MSFHWDELKVERRLVAVGLERRYIGASNVRRPKSYGALTSMVGDSRQYSGHASTASIRVFLCIVVVCNN